MTLLHSFNGQNTLKAQYYGGLLCSSLEKLTCASMVNVLAGSNSYSG